MHTLGIQEKAIKVCSRHVKPPLNKTRKAAGSRVPIMPATSTTSYSTSHADKVEEHLQSVTLPYKQNLHNPKREQPIFAKAKASCTAKGTEGSDCLASKDVPNKV